MFSTPGYQLYLWICERLMLGYTETDIYKMMASINIAKSYLQQSNQLFVTRILGLSGYDAGPSWSITTIANVDVDTVGFNCLSSTTVDCVTTCVEYETYE